MPTVRIGGPILSYGMAEEDGLRCPYHGWKFDRAGRCLEQPFEETVKPGGFKDKIQLANYAAEELGGMIFAYLGPSRRPWCRAGTCWWKTISGGKSVTR